MQEEIKNQKNIAVIMEGADQWTYYPQGMANPSTARALRKDKPNDIVELKKILELHKSMEQDRLVCVLDYKGENFSEELRRIFENNSSHVLNSVFVNNDAQAMKEYSYSVYFQEYLQTHPHIIADYWNSRSRWAQAHAHYFNEGNQGSQEGGTVFIDGKKYYAKFYENEDRMRSEWLSWMIMREVGVPVAGDMIVTRINGRMAILSQWEEPVGNKEFSSEELALEYLAGVFLQDRDRGKVDNYVSTARGKIPIDFGGSGPFRSTGGLKGEGEDNLPFGVENFMEMLSLNGEQRQKSFYTALRQNPELISRATALFASRLSEPVLAALIKAVGMTEPIQAKVTEVYGDSLRLINEMAVNGRLDQGPLAEIPKSVNAIRQVAGHSASAEQIWNEVFFRVDMVEPLHLIFQMASGRSAGGRSNATLKEHTREVFEGLVFDPAKEQVDIQPFSVVTVLRMAALFHDAGKFIESDEEDNGPFSEIMSMLDISTQRQRGINKTLEQQWQRLKKDIMDYRATPKDLRDRNFHEQVSIWLAQMFMPAMGFANQVEIELVKQIIEKDKFGALSMDLKYGSLKNAQVEALNEKLKPSRALCEAFPQTGRWTLTRDVLAMAEVLAEADMRPTSLRRLLTSDGRHFDQDHFRPWFSYKVYLEAKVAGENVLKKLATLKSSSVEDVSVEFLERVVKMIVLDFDNTISLRGEAIDPDTIKSIRTLLESGVTKLVIISGSSTERILRKLGLTECPPNLIIRGRYGYERAAGAQITQTFRTELSKIQEIMKAIQESPLAESLKLDPKGKLRSGERELVLRVAREQVKSMDKIISNLKLLPVLEGMKFFVSNDNRLHISSIDKEDALEQEIQAARVDPNQVLIIADDLGPYGTDEGLSKVALGDPMIINVGNRIANKPNMFQFPNVFEKGAKVLLDVLATRAKSEATTLNLTKILEKSRNLPTRDRNKRKNNRQLELVDRAMKSGPGGIDLTPANMNVQVKTGEDKAEIASSMKSASRNDASLGIQFHLNSAMLAQLQNAPGFVPVIINIQAMTNLKEFLGINEVGFFQGSPDKK